jgi:tetratricopeptide (TPR) repeat protein
MSRPGVGGLLLLMWTSSVSLAQEAPAADLAEEAELHFSLAVERYKVADYSGALEHLLASNRLAPNKNVQFNIARTYEKLEQFNQAYRHYADYLQVEADPAQRKIATESLARIAPKVALVDVVTDPPGATVYVDRRELGARGRTLVTWPWRRVSTPCSSSARAFTPGASWWRSKSARRWRLALSWRRYRARWSW